MFGMLRGLTRVLFMTFVLATVALGVGIGVVLWQINRDLPDLTQIAHYVPGTGSKVYAADGAQIAELETKHRIPVAIGQVPQTVVRAFLAAEDHDFYRHSGIDPAAILRAAVADVLRLQRGERPLGASTITQQVVRHFLLSNKVSLTRKIKEAILANRIERTLSKNRILEIYLNEIFLGANAYGVAAAADTYFQKPLDRLSLAEAALLAALPKAPNNYNPIHHPQAAKARRDWVIASMAELGWISAADAKAAAATPLGVHLRPEIVPQYTGYFAEEVRRELIGRFGEKAVYEGGLRVRSSYSAAYQQMAETAFRNGLVVYDRRHGWRGPVAHYPNVAAAQRALANTPDPAAPDGWQLAAVTRVDYRDATVELRDGSFGRIALEDMRWARRTLKDQRLGAAVRNARDVVADGDLVLVEKVGAATGVRRGAAMPTYALRQIPNVSGGVVVMDPKTGRVFALVGGWSSRQSQFDRATQALRQPGSAIKPLVYATALEHGFTPSSMVEDEPVSLPQGPGLPAWQPANYEGSYVGPTTLEDALIHSRNLATVHVAMTIGLPAIARTVENFDIMDKMPLYYSMALGAGDTTLLRLTGAYAMIDNGGHWLLPSVIDLVQDRDGHILYQKGVAGCAACFVSTGTGGGAEGGSLYRAAGAPAAGTAAVANASFAASAVLYRPRKPDPLLTTEADHELISMMQGVVQRGTGIAVSAVGKPLAGKTGTTSDWRDAWFVGFSPDLVAGIYVGFDEPRTLGGGEVGGHVAAPIFRDFMMAALRGKAATPFPVPAGAYGAMASAEPYAAAPDDQERGEMDQPDAATDDNPSAEQASRDGSTPPPTWRRSEPPRRRAYAAAPSYYGFPWAQFFPPWGSGPPQAPRQSYGYPAYPTPYWPSAPGYHTGGY